VEAWESVAEGTTRIDTGSRIAIIGGGPAGSSFALYLLHYANETGIQPDITIFETHDFNERGPKGCKGCAGILSMSLQRNLSELGLTIPEEIILSKIEHYTVHTPYTSITITNPEKEIKIASVYRGGGPSLSRFKNQIGFDSWLLREAQKRGARVEIQTISHIFLGPRPMIQVGDEKLAYDLVVMASGVNATQIPIQGLGYIPPRTQVMAQAELYVGAQQVESLLGHGAHAFLVRHPGLIFGALIPKGPFINVSVLSSGNHPVSVLDFLNFDIVRSILPEQYRRGRACGCRPRAIISSAHNYYADRFVAVGDAAISRLYKDGIGSSLLAAREAACTAVYHGVSRQDFERYYKPFCRSIDRDNRFGKLLFDINDKAKGFRIFLLAQERLIGDEQINVRGPQPFTKAVWGLFTGIYSYRNIARMTLNPISLARLVVDLSQEGLNSLLHRGVTYPMKLYVGGKKVLVLGSGFGGIYVLRRLVPSLDRNENIETTMVSDENFFLFTPFLPEVAMGRIETRHIAFPIRNLEWRHRFNFIHANVEKIDLETRKVITNVGTLDFDYIVLALGSVTDVTALSSASHNVFYLKTLRDSIIIRNHIIGLFEQASVEKDPERQRQLLTFVVSGGGYTGVQVASELSDFIRNHLPRFYNTVNPSNIRIILVELGRKIGAYMHTKLGDYTMKQLQQMGIEVRLKSRVTRTWEDHMEINGMEQIPTSTIIWTAGVVANPRIAELDAEKDGIGRVLVNEYLEMPGFPGVYALGDCAHFKDPKSGLPVAPRAHNAVRQAKVVAHNILAEIRGREKRPYRYSDAPEIVSLGPFKAALRINGLRMYGFPARLIWQLSYSLLVTGMYNRIRIIMDWLLPLIFGRDTTLLKLKR